MKVLLLEDIPKLGKLGDVVAVRPGFARNFLFPRGKAERASDAAVADFAGRRAELEARQKNFMNALQKARDALDGYTVQISSRAGPDGNLYGSVTAAIIAATLNRQSVAEGMDIKRGQIQLPDGALKKVGEHEISVVLHPQLKAQIKVSVLSEAGGAAESPTPAANNETAQGAKHAQ